MMRRGALVLVFFLSAGARATLLPVDVQPIAGTYTGLAPCADCAGITTTITLTDPDINAGIQAGAFVMDMVYKGHSARIRITGRWDLIPPQDALHGMRESGIVRLIPYDDGTANTPRYYYCESGQALRMLDGNGRELPDLVPHTLLRVKIVPKKRTGK